MPRVLPTRAAALLLVVAAVAALAGCGVEHTEGEPRREGLALPLDGVAYEVLLTRQINPHDVEDMGYLREEIEPPPPGQTFYGVFVQACNITEEPQRTASSFRMVDTTGAEFEPVELDVTNPFAYHPTELEPTDCFPPEGSLAQTGPASAALLLFQVPIDATENRPLELVIQQGYSLAESDPNELIVELDL